MGVDGSYPLLLVIWLSPLAGALLLWAFGPQLRKAGGIVGVGAAALAFVATLGMWGAGTQLVNSGGVPLLGAHQTLGSWMPGMSFGLLFDPLALIWTLIITGVGSLIHFYSLGYMAGDRAFARFFAYLNFFLFAMLTLVLSDNFVGLLVGWGLVGLASYLLIGFWFERPTAVAAARKAFVMNVVGDIGILAAIFIMFAYVHSTSYADVFAGVQSHALTGQVLFAVCIGLFVGCAAKSAQVPLHTWLPDAMEGPTPVSALIHAATMVTAGVYLIARCFPLWNSSPEARELAGLIGAITALTGAILGMGQWDIKRILAYSTMSQIGYMIMGVGVGAYSAGVLHFFTHAFFKAQLFLGSGIIIHALADEQDVRKMGGLAKRLPFAFAALGIGTLSICGVPGFSGFFSKDAVIYGTLLHGHPYLYAIGVITAGITAYYMFRMLFMVFFGEYRGNVDASDLGMRHPELAGVHDAGHAQAQHAHAPAWLMMAPVAILMVPSIFIGWLNVGGENSPWAKFIDPQFGPAQGLTGAPLSEIASTLIVLAIVAAGILIAYLRYATPAFISNAVERLRNETVRMPGVLVHAFYVDAAYEMLFIRPVQAVGGAILRWMDPVVLDGAVWEVAHSAKWLGHLFRSFQTGLVRAYALTIVFGAACFIAYYVVAGGVR